jgi:hypothetical protein
MMTVILAGLRARLGDNCGVLVDSNVLLDISTRIQIGTKGRLRGAPSTPC